MRIAALGLGISVSFALFSAGSAAMAQDGLAAYQGAWLSGGEGCGEVYTSAGKGMAFKKPVDIFSPAFIISGRRLRTPLASCRIKSLRPNGNHQLMLLDCANAVSVDAVHALISQQPDGSLKRYLNEQDTTGTTYIQCSR
jgi:hypothetical protein